MRAAGTTGAQGRTNRTDSHGRFVIDISARRVFNVDGTEISLTGVEFRMVEILLRRPGHLVSREQILEEIWALEG